MLSYTLANDMDVCKRRFKEVTLSELEQGGQKKREKQ